MTIQQAIKSGKPFRRKAWGKRWPRVWYVNTANTYKRWGSLVHPFWSNWHLGSPRTIRRDMLATDWEVKK